MSLIFPRSIFLELRFIAAESIASRNESLSFSSSTISERKCFLWSKVLKNKIIKFFSNLHPDDRFVRKALVKYFLSFRSRFLALLNRWESNLLLSISSSAFQWLQLLHATDVLNQARFLPGFFASNLLHATSRKTGLFALLYQAEYSPIYARPILLVDFLVRLVLLLVQPMHQMLN